ncbi:MAG: hypothetical protein A2Z29_03745 [Chloroflexi bacterium RBG_16_56_11]|nr:MAG: hypothetical protein A2Z29_03745 [Chloroflexi bacterium RBG_16_56_11]
MIKSKVCLLAVLLLVLFLAPVVPVKADAMTVDYISGQLICQCGCTSVLNNCTHAECHSRESMTNLIRQKVDQGESAAAIIQYFVAQYGEQVLSSPPKKGFNLTAWLLPFAAIMAGGAVIYFALKKWVKRGTHQPEGVVPVNETDKEYERRVENELSGFTHGGFR